MNFLDYINPFNKVTDLISEVVEDKDKANEIKRELMQAAEATYNNELSTKTVPWVDALHKMGRQITGYLGYGLAFYMVYRGGVDPMAVMAAVAPGGIYAAFKNKGK
jgi:hypothetical protein